MRKTTIEDFLGALGVVADEGWRVSPVPNNRIVNANGACPVCSLANYVLGHDDWRIAAHSASEEAQLGLSDHDVMSIVSAADAGGEYDEDLRQALISILT